MDMAMTTQPGTNSIQNTTCDPLRLTYKNPSFTLNEYSLANRKDIWHKFILFHSTTAQKRDLLDPIILASSLEAFIPVSFKKETSTKSTFLAKCGAEFIETLMKYNLQIPMATGEYIRMDIVLGYQTSTECKVNPQLIICQVFQQRYDPFKKCLNLDDFHNDKRLSPVYCPLSAPMCLNLVLRSVRIALSFNPRETKFRVRELSMRSNELTSFLLQEKLVHFHLTKIDFRNNKLTSLKQLNDFSEFNITELWVDGNPLCTMYTRPDDYVKAAKTLFPNLQVLDGVMVGVDKKFVPTIQRNYLGDGSRLSLVKQFVRHYFNLYDQADRSVLNGLYDTGAMFSMTLGSITNFNHIQMLKSFATNRNLLKFVDYAKCQEFLLHGPDNIIYTLCRQPKTCHNVKTFQIDLIFQSDNCISIAIQGYFLMRDCPFPALAFSRTFILISKEDNEYCICNDQYHIESVPSESKCLQSFENRIKPIPKYMPVPLSNAEKEQLLQFLHELTGMNREYCVKSLEKTNWDVRSAIKNFMQAYTINNVPREAFR